MNINELINMYDFNNKTAIVTGGTGVLGGEIAGALAGCGANVAIIDLNTNLTPDMKSKLDKSSGNVDIFKGNVLDKDSMQKVIEKIAESFGEIDFLINTAGGNHPQATTSTDLSFFNIPLDAFNKVLSLNLMGTILPSQVTGK
ncbi:MAG: SDR family NAD(P)-dependent oxidoreductase, partial [Candidatus Neomarinimicrobiota bacterium]